MSSVHSPASPRDDPSVDYSDDDGYDSEPPDGDVFDVDHGLGRRENGRHPGYPDTMRDAVPFAHVSSMPQYDPSFLGEGIEVAAPVFNQGGASASGWADFDDAAVPNVTPKRAMCFNIPVECFSTKADRMTHWQTPMQNAARATDIAALLGFLWTPTSMGFLSGKHEEIATATGTTENGEQKEDKKPARVYRYMYRSEAKDPNDRTDTARQASMPMFVMAYEEVYDRSRTQVLAVRIWKLVFDPEHSDSELVRQMMDWNHRVWAQSGVAHKGVARGGNSAAIAAEHKAVRQMAGGGSVADPKLEFFAGTQYLRITTENVYAQMLPIYAGASDKSRGRPAVRLQDTPVGTLNRRIEKAWQGEGGTHPLSPEWVFNGKRRDALCAGLVHLNGELMNVDPSQMDPSSYFDPRGALQLPDWLREDKRGYFFMTDPSKCNIFDLPLPRPLAGDVTPGDELMTLFRERVAPHVPAGSPRLLDLFRNYMTGSDQWTEKHIRDMAESICTFDTVGATDDERVQINAAKRAMSGGLRSYGCVQNGDNVIEPRQILKDLAYESSTVHSKLIQPWVDDMRSKIDQERTRIEAESGGEDSLAQDLEQLLQKKEAFKERHNRVMKEHTELFLSRMERAFTSRDDAETIPRGFRAVWDGLQRELDEMPNRTANIAFGLDNSMVNSDRSSFAQLQNWLGAFFEDDCFVDGRDWRLMQELLCHAFEQFGETTLLLIFCGPKGARKAPRARTGRTLAPLAPLALSSGRTFRQRQDVAHGAGHGRVCRRLDGHVGPVVCQGRHARQLGQQQRMQLHLRRDIRRSDRPRRLRPHRVLEDGASPPPARPRPTPPDADCVRASARS
jgi:hypothetical protein